MASDSFVQPSIPRFDGHYDHWSMLMENFLRSKEYWQVVSMGIPESGTSATDAQRLEIDALKLKDLNAKNYLFQAIDRSTLETILCKDTPKDIWDSMKKKFQGSTRARRQTMVIVSKMRTFGEKIEDVVVVKKILRSLIPKFNYVVCSIEESKDLDLLSIDELQGSLLVHERKLVQQNNAELALKVSSDHSIKGNGGRKSNGHNDRGRGRGRSRGRGRGNYGHRQNSGNQSNERARRHGTSLSDQMQLWHFRYGHLGFGGLQTLKWKNMVVGLPQFSCPTNVCEECVLSKQHRESFPKGKSERARNLLEIVHSDICGPINPISNGGKCYLITFIDDLSRKIWVDFLQEKSEALTAFKRFKAIVEKEVGHSIQVLRTDHGGEYNSHDFTQFCEEHGIKRQLTAAYTPQQNGVSERKNRTIFNMVRSLLQRSKVPKSFWPEAVNWSIHILNRSPTFSVRNMTLEEAWSGRRPDVSHFRIFGCIAYAHVPDQKRKKLEDKGEKCIFLGVSECTKAFKLYNPRLRKLSSVVMRLNNQNGKKEMDDEIAAIERNKTWELTKLPKGHKTIDVKWVYKMKLKETGEVDKCKARLVAKGYSQEFGIDYKEVFARVVRHDTIRLVIALAAQNSWPIFQLDVKSAFLHGDLSEQTMLDKFKKSMMTEFNMSDLGRMRYFLGVEVAQSDAGIFISQRKYVQEILKNFKWRTAIRLIHGTSKGNASSSRKKILRYLQGTIDYGILYKKAEKSDLIGFTDSDYARDQDDRKSTSGYVFMLGSGAVSWSSRKQPIVTLSTTEAELVAASTCVCQAIWMRKLLEEVHFKQKGPTIIYCDNSSTIKLSKNPILHGRSKHIDFRYHFLRDRVNYEEIDMVYCRSEDQIADIFTKALKLATFQKLQQMLGVCKMTNAWS
ncbi:hypothetical protein F3Y22_tig00001818pilonHSYRG00071 [Hibiscus syriacus]|uniref:Integrase catalytic domain-containing protein n=1 Tax=Hibiscus syriacus TaxID=106335 RepID=A0A6A3CZW7_HIBSY|nr:hypothetical protein F3Y22_tig00001818pilonHSYRG00071 [Hibiscus syriacus]